MRATKVKLYEKTGAKGRKHLFLDFWPPLTRPDTGSATRREHLGLYVYEKPRTDLERTHNRETRLLAEALRAKRQLAIQEDDFGFLRPKPDGDFLAYFRALGEKRGTAQRTRESWLTAAKYLARLTGEPLPFSQLNVACGAGFKDFLLTASTLRNAHHKLAHNSAALYFARFLAALRQAYKDGRLSENLAARLEPIPLKETQREFLTLTELQRLANTDCGHEMLKQAALFSALTGLRWSDIAKLTWGEVHDTDAGAALRFTQAKTGGVETLPISAEARELLGTRGTDGVRVWPDLKYSVSVNLYVARWMAAAGITRKITFHCFRHTYATLQLHQGTDLYTVSKMLGHRSIKTTEIYARIVDAKKREAANKIRLGVIK